MYSEPITLTVHLRADSTYTPATPTGLVLTHRNLSPFTLFCVHISLCLLYSSHPSFFASLSFPFIFFFKVCISGCLLRGVLRKLILVLALYAMLGLSQSAPAPALIRGDSLPDSSAQELSVKRPVMGIVVNTETPQSTRLTRGRSHMTNYEETLIHFSHNKLVIILSVIET